MERPWQRTPLPPPEIVPPAMLTEEEKRYLVWLGESVHAGWGAVVDLGCWLGASTALLAEGMRRAGVAGRVRAFDRFVWERSYMEPVHGAGLPDQGDFRPLFDRYVAPWADRVEASTVDLLRFRWDGSPIEILYVDAAKTLSLLNAILRAFGPSLVPARTLVVLQDFRDWSTWFLPLVFGGRPDLWERVHDIDDGTTVAFRPRRAIGGAGELEEYSRASFPYGPTAERLRSLAEAEAGANRIRLLLALARFIALEGPAEDAAALRARLLAEPGFAAFAHLLPRVQRAESDALAEAWDSLHAGRTDEAEARARALVAADPEDLRARDLLAVSLLGLRRLDESERLLDEIVRENPAFPVARVHRARLLLDRGRPAEAATEAEEGFRRARGDPEVELEAWRVLALARRDGGDVAGAVEALDGILGLRPAETEARAWRAIALRHLGRNAPALADARAVLAADPGNAVAARLVSELEAGGAPPP